MDLELVNFDNPAEVRTFAKGRSKLYKVGPATIGRATYEPGWKWSEQGHDSWVVGDEPYVSLHILGSEDYAIS